VRHGRRRIALLVAVAGIFAGSACSQPAQEPATAPTDSFSRQTRVPGEYLVTLAEGADAKAIADVYGRFVIKQTRRVGENLFLVTLTADPGPAKVEELRGQSAQIKAVQPNFVYRSNDAGKIR
jgi:hypothetical protein